MTASLERLEELAAPSSIQHVVTVTCVSADGSPAGDGYKIEGSSAGGEWRRTSLRQADDHVG